MASNISAMAFKLLLAQLFPLAQTFNLTLSVILTW
jgi:hypothetical protein